MIFRETPIAGVIVLDVEPEADERGMFARTFDSDELQNAGLVSEYPQQSVAYNLLAGTLRGLHFQIGDPAESKIVRCTRGAIFDVAVDLRSASPTFGQWYGVELNAAERRSLYIPAGCAHGYQTLSDDTECLYLISTTYRPGDARGIHYLDPQLHIAWPLPVSCLSKRDRQLPNL